MSETTMPTGESIFLVPFNLFYNFGFVPFRTKQSEVKKRYEIQTCCIQKIVCAVIHLLTIIYQFHYFLICCHAFRNNSEANLVAFFELVCSVTYSFSAFLLIFNVWREQESYLQFLEYSRCKAESRQAKFLNVILMVYFGIWGAFAGFQIHNSQTLTLKQINSFPQNNASTLVETIGNGTSIDRTDRNYQFYFDIALYWGYTLTYAYTFSFFAFVCGTLLALTLALRQIGAEFQTRLENTKENSGIDKGLRLYKKLKRTNDFAREMYGDFMLGTYISFVTYCVEAPVVFLGQRGQAEIIVFIFFAFVTIIWILAAEFHYKVHHAILEWTTLYSEYDSLCVKDKLKMYLIRLEMSTYPIALSCRCFSITYKHLSSMFGVVATYGIIVIQLNSE
ncbi:unnamed protein product [Orchesella dallaii]|uniref:Odorant receptor n=1 Tax=Orchesella dallaii TaxID=48710 RepID=A0ABP1QN34_9HEXA